MTMGDKIHTLRKTKNMTLTELGQRVGVGASTVRKWETGFIENVKRDKIKKLADALETTPGYLMGWDEAKETASVKVVPKLRSVARLEELDISEEEDEDIRDFIDFLLSKRKSDG
jgi:Predicted transcriptional regulators